MKRGLSSARPYMPGYGTLPANEGSGLLPWSWAEERLVTSRNYWMVTVWPDLTGSNGRPHAMPVWGMWHEGTFLFSSSNLSRKAKNLIANPRCVITTEDALNPVVVEGTAEKYETDYKIDSLDPAVNSCFRVRPRWAFGIKHDDFEGSPTKWNFEG
jgi:hypothetical protein